MFKVNNENFEIENAYMDGQLDDEEDKVLILGLEIDAKPLDNNTQPLITSDTLLRIKRNEIKKWQDIGGKIIKLRKYSKNIWRPHVKFVNLYKKISRGNFIYNAKIEFKNIDDKIFIKLVGLCDSKWNGKEIQTLSLDIETEVNFTWIQMGPHESEEIARKRLEPYLNTEYFKYTVDKNNTGIIKDEMGKFTFSDIKNK